MLMHRSLVEGMYSCMRSESRLALPVGRWLGPRGGPRSNEEEMSPHVY